jgi:hypothetical protein
MTGQPAERICGDRDDLVSYIERLSDEEPPLSPAQRLLLTSIYARFPRDDDANRGD